MTTMNACQVNSNALTTRTAKLQTGVRKERWIAALAVAMLCLGADPSTGEPESETGSASESLTRGLAGHWTFDDGKGSLARDVSGRDNHGTIMGGAKWVEGKIGGALQFDGTDDFVSIPNESDFDITGSVTLSAWIRVESFTNPWQGIVTKGDRAWRLHRANNTKRVGFACSDLSRDQVGDLYGKRDVADGQWHHVAGVLDGTRASIFVDGTLDASADSSPNISVNDYAVLIGANAQVTGRLFHGLIDDVRIYDRALSVDELRALVKEGGTAVPPPSKAVARKPEPTPPPPLPSLPGEFQEIFDGKTLAGWNALDMSYWAIRDGAITGQSTVETPCTSNQFMVWQGGDVADFELKLKFRVRGNGCNSGVQFRSKIREDGLAIGYQADIYQSGGYLGGVCDELHKRDGPELLSANGSRTVIDKDGKRTRIKIETEATFKKWPQWNDYHIIAKGHQMILRINGVTASELIDNEEAHFDLKGILGLQLRSGEPMTVQFKDIYLKQMNQLEESFTPPFDEPRRDIKYDTRHERNVLDFWPAPTSDDPTPVYVWFHGGGFQNGDKTQLEKNRRATLDAHRKAGYAMVACNYYPFLSDDIDHLGIARHCARAVQFIRFRAKDWNFDPQRLVLVCGGVSAGALISEFLGYHDDFANPESEDTVSRQSSRPRVVVSIMQPRGTEQFALRFMDKGEAPIFIYSNAAPSDRIHPPWAAIMIRDKAMKLGIPCVALGGGRNKLPRVADGTTWLEQQLEFCQKHLSK